MNRWLHFLDDTDSGKTLTFDLPKIIGAPDCPQEVDSLVTLCMDNNLTLNTDKTKAHEKGEEASSASVYLGQGCSLRRRDRLVDRRDSVGRMQNAGYPSTLSPSFFIFLSFFIL